MFDAQQHQQQPPPLQQYAQQAQQQQLSPPPPSFPAFSAPQQQQGMPAIPFMPPPVPFAPLPPPAGQQQNNKGNKDNKQQHEKSRSRLVFAGVLLFLLTMLVCSILLYAWGPALIRPRATEPHILSAPSFGLATLYSVPAAVIAVCLWWLVARS